ncbi:formate dehydrogenase accessory sulfurtransferase FdhD, partial [Brucella sp. 21LCYQ03]|nr:formate dehydrogenase accessory sulfurtransferase FdhD [Brucella sp. 21LCYQ03]
AVKKVEIIRINDNKSLHLADEVSVEEPLEIRVSFGHATIRESKNISVTMRTPGNDPELAMGFLFTEGIISNYQQIESVTGIDAACSRNQENVIIVRLTNGFIPELTHTDRNFYTTSSCGVCGKGSIQSIRTVSTFKDHVKEEIRIDTETLYQLPNRLRSFQNNFSATGGIHASGLFNLRGDLLALREDVGRHNALDKLIGYALSANLLPLDSNILLLSGRASFELIQKAAMAGIAIVAAIGAPSSLAVELAEDFDMTLIGFLKDNRCNIYTKSSHHHLDVAMV